MMNSRNSQPGFHEWSYKRSSGRYFVDSMADQDLDPDVHGMTPTELQSIGITNKAQRAFLAQTLGAMEKGTK